MTASPTLNRKRQPLPCHCARSEAISISIVPAERDRFAAARLAMTAERKGTDMAEFDLVIRNGTVATAADTTVCDIGIRNGTIVALGQGLAAGDRDIDAA